MLSLSYIVVVSLLVFILLVIMICHFTEKKRQLDIDNCSGMGPSIYTDTKSTTFTEVCFYQYM